MACLFPDEIVFLGKRQETDRADILLPDFTYSNAVLLKRYSDDPTHYVQLVGDSATYEFRQIFDFLSREYQDRCLSHSTRKANTQLYQTEWEKFEDVLRFGVSDRPEGGCISFSDLRASTQFLNTYGKNVYLNKIQQPFFEQTGLISRKYRGRIDKFMGDNVMCVFLKKISSDVEERRQERDAVLKNFFAVFWLCRVLYQITVKAGYEQSNLGLRSGMTYGDQILRSNLGNEIVRDFTVTGETVNLAARLEHITMPELIIHNQNYFRKAIERFPHIKELLAVTGDRASLNPETQTIINDFTVYQNTVSNLETLEQIKFDIRFNEAFYERLRKHLLDKGYEFLNSDTASLYGYEQFSIEGFDLRFYFSYYNPKGFSQYEKIWILPLEPEILINLDIDQIA
jgi:class 3 adenylate cyclase